MCICVCVYIYVYREHAKRRNRFISRFPSFFFSRSAKREFYNHASLCTSLIRFIFIGYRFPASPLRHFYAIREIRVRETTRSSRDISLYDKYSSLFLVRSRTTRRGHRFSPFSSPSPWIDRRCTQSERENPIPLISILISIHRGSSGRRSWSSDLHRFTRDGRGGESFGSEKDLRRERNAKGREREREKRGERREGTRGEVPSRSNKNIYIAFSM